MMLKREIGKSLDKRKLNKAIAFTMAAVLTLLNVNVVYADEVSGTDSYTIDENDFFGTVTNGEGADDGGTTIQIDNYTGEAYSDYSDYVDINKITINESCYYSNMEKIYVYDPDNFSAIQSSTTEYITANVTSGMIVNEIVSIYVPKDKKYKMYKDGEEVKSEDIELSAISDIGFYTFVAYASNGVEKDLFSFQIIGEATNDSMFSLGSNFMIINATRDGEYLEIGDTRNLDMKEEGEYVIEYVGVKSGMDKIINLTVDHTPPTLKLKEVDKKSNTAKSAVDISDLEDEAELIIKLDGKKVDNSGVMNTTKNQLTEYGRYELTVIDEAGNKTNYKFTILVYLTWSSVLFIVLLIALVVALIVYIKVSQKKMRVR